MELHITTRPDSPNNRLPHHPTLQPAQGASAIPLTTEQMDQITQAKIRAKKIRKAEVVAMVNGSILATFSVGSFLFVAVSALFGGFDVVGLVMGVGLAIFAWNEFRGRAMLKRLEARGCRVLGWNQLGLMTLIIGYAVWMLGKALWGPNPYEAIGNEAALTSTFGSISQLYKTISLAMYGGVIVGTLIFQGLNSLYYFTRRKHVQAYLRDTPGWVVKLQRCPL